MTLDLTPCFLHFKSTLSAVHKFFSLGVQSSGDEFVRFMCQVGGRGPQPSDLDERVFLSVFSVKLS